MSIFRGRREEEEGLTINKLTFSPEAIVPSKMRAFSVRKALMNKIPNHRGTDFESNLAIFKWKTNLETSYMKKNKEQTEIIRVNYFKV